MSISFKAVAKSKIQIEAKVFLKTDGSDFAGVTTQYTIHVGKMQPILVEGEAMLTQLIETLCAETSPAETDDTRGTKGMG